MQKNKKETKKIDKYNLARENETKKFNVTAENLDKLLQYMDEIEQNEVSNKKEDCDYGDR